MNGGFKITVGSLPDYDDLVAEIYIGEEFIGLISQEAGPDAIAFEVAPVESSLKIDLGTFEAALAHAKKRLIELRKRS